MAGTARGLDLYQLCQRLEAVEGVTDVHDIHAWSMTTGYDAFSAHVSTDLSGNVESDQLLPRLREIASREFGISHVTIQLEDTPQWCVEDHHIDHPEGEHPGEEHPDGVEQSTRPA